MVEGNRIKVEREREREGGIVNGGGFKYGADIHS